MGGVLVLPVPPLDVALRYELRFITKMHYHPPRRCRFQFLRPITVKIAVLFWLGSFLLFALCRHFHGPNKDQARRYFPVPSFKFLVSES